MRRCIASATATGWIRTPWPQWWAANDPLADHEHARRWWEVLILIVAVGIFVWLALGTRAQHISVNLPWMLVLIAGTIVPLGIVRHNAVAADAVLVRQGAREQGSENGDCERRKKSRMASRHRVERISIDTRV